MTLNSDIRELPYKKESKKWSFFNTYELKTIRDIFVFISQNPVTEEQLYEAMENKTIKPPKDRWSVANSIDNKNRDRQKLEYLHGAKYLGFVNNTNSKLQIDLEKFRVEKTKILEANRGRRFEFEKETPNLKQEEIKSLLPIILDYSRAKDYLWWFLNFEKFLNANDFDLEDLKAHGQPIYLNKQKDQKASEVIFRCVDSKVWKIPYDEYLEGGNLKRTNDYTRSVTYVFPAWFQDLEIINRIPIIKEFGFMEGNWELHYPIRNRKIDIDKFEKFILEKFNNRLNRTNVIWIPKIIYQSILEFQLPVNDIKEMLIKLYEDKKPTYIMERSSLQVMRYSNNLRNNNKHQELFLNYRDFPRSNFIINN